MKRFLILIGALFIMQTYDSLSDSANDTIWKKGTHNIYALEFSPTNNYFLSYGSHGGQSRKGVIIFNTEGDTIKVIYNSEGLEFRGGQGIWDAHFSKDGRFLVVIWEYDKDNMAHGLLEIFETENWTSVKRIDVPGDDFSLLGAQVLISPDNNTVVAITMDGFYFYDVQSGELLKHLWNYGQNLNKNIIIASAIYSNDGGQIYFTSTDVNPSTTGDEKLRFLNTQTYEVEYTSDAIAHRTAISKNGNMITKVLNLDELQIINPLTKEIILRIPVHTDEINSMVFSPDEKYLTVNFGRGKVIHVYDIQAGKSVYQYTTVPSGYGLGGVSISLDQKYLITSSGNFLYFYKFLPTTGIEDNPEKKEEIIYPNPNNGIFSIQFHLPKAGLTIVQIYDNTGRIIKKVFQGHLESGKQKITSDIRGLKSGNFFVKVSSVGTEITFKLIVTK
jgi:WD40 repeat protein